MTAEKGIDIDRVRHLIRNMEDDLRKHRRTIRLLRTVAEGREIKTFALLPIVEYFEVIRDQLEDDLEIICEKLKIDGQLEKAAE